ncbi:MAG: antibiotic biosynthesis monooxygenase family protein [Thermomicrobiales bacterium]
MHARVGIYKVKPGTLDASLEKARAELLPKMREQPGLSRYTVVRTGPDSFVSLSRWETRAQAEQAEKTLSGWVKEHMGPSVVSMQSHIGETTFTLGQTAPDKTPKYGVVRVQTPKPDAPDLTEKVRTEFMPIYEAQPGFNMFTSIVTDGGKRLSYAGWDSKEAFEKAQPTLSTWGEANVRPHMADVQVHQGEVAWAVRK